VTTEPTPEELRQRRVANRRFPDAPTVEDLINENDLIDGLWEAIHRLQTRLNAVEARLDLGCD
jgi:hypothetical protein